MEVEARQAFEMLTMDLKSQIELATASRTEKSEAKAKALQGAADGKGDLTDTTSVRDADSKYLSDLTATCSQKATDFESRQQLRAEELVAIEKAIEIISSEVVAGNAETYLPTLVQKGKKATSLAQLRSTHDGAQRKVAEYLQH